MTPARRKRSACGMETSPRDYSAAHLCTLPNSLCGIALHELHVLERQAAHGLSRRRMNSIENGGRHHAYGGLSDATPEVMRRDENRLDLRHLGKPHDAIRVEIQIHHTAVLDPALAVERGGQAVGDGAFDLSGNLARVDRVAAVEREHHA